MKKPTHEEIRSALNRLNWNYGRGDVVSFFPKTGGVFIKKQYGFETAHYRIVNRTVYFRGHQMTV